MIRQGSKFKIVKRGHWAYGKVFTCTDARPQLRIIGNADQPDLTWRDGELIEYKAYTQNRWQAYLIHSSWCRELDNNGEKQD